MCTLVVAWQVFDVQLAVAANRDELRDRSSTPPAIRDWGPAVVAPKDEAAGGTWIGYNEYGVFVAITNRWTDATLAGDRSRGHLVRDALGEKSAESAGRLIEGSIRGRTYDGFNLVVADANAALLFEWDGQLTVSTLEPGVHVVINVGADGQYQIPTFREGAGEQQAANANRLYEVLQPKPGETAGTWIDRASSIISDHEYGMCIHEDTFGTRSSSLLLLDDDERTYQYADGPPCRTSYRTVESHI